LHVNKYRFQFLWSCTWKWQSSKHQTNSFRAIAPSQAL